MLKLPAISLAGLTLLCMLAWGCGSDDSSTPEDQARCGDGHVDPGERCDDGNTNDGDGCSSACQDEVAAECGNGELEAGEQCDDGNTDSGDGCSATCQDEAAAECGNGVVEAGEQCDDGNTEGGDGCSSTCQDEAAAECGNGVVEAGEQCDDGNDVPEDGCEPDCTLTPDEIVCAALDPLPSGTCAVTAGDASKLIVGTVITPATIYRGGQVLVDAAGQITCVGCDCDLDAGGATQIVCPAGVVTPGLINTHDHITFAQNSPYTDTGERYEHRHDWRKGVNGHEGLTTPGGASGDEIRWGELRFLMGGATSTVGSGSASGFLRNLDKENDQEGLGQPAVHFETFPLGDSSGTQAAQSCLTYPSIDSAQDIAGDDAYFPHVSEGIDAFARNEFLCLSGAQAGAEDVTQDQSAFIHSIGLRPVDYARMAQRGTSLIWSPRSNVTLYGDTAQVTTAARLGVLIALGTDWIATGSMNMLRELRCADDLNSKYYDHFFTDRQLFDMATLNAARAAAMDDAIGVLAPGRVADISVWNGATNADYRAVLDAQPADVVLVMRGGEVLYGDQDVVSAVAGAGACDGLDVCGSQKSLCASGDIGKSLATLQASVGAGIYPAFFCGTPANEPSCTPTRPVSVRGSSVYTGAIVAGDMDGDGLGDATDLCPTVFSPIRPLDMLVQADFDGDGVGDACDPCPLDPGTDVCSPLDGADIDLDGVPDADDVCPLAQDPGQEDSDADGKGDACDQCPDTFNSGTSPCPYDIYELKAGSVPLGSSVALESGLVTATGASGFFVQVAPGDADYQGPDNSGIYVYAPANAVLPGDRVHVDATLQNYYGQIQLSNATVTIESSSEPLPDPVVELAANLGTGGTRAAALEGVLVKVLDAAVTDVAPPSGPGDAAQNNEFVVDGALRVDDLLYLVTPFPVVGEVFDELVGVLNYRNGDSKLEPRDAADLIAGAPQIADFGPATGLFLRQGDVAAVTFPEVLTVTLTRAPDADVFVSISPADPAYVTVVGNGVTIPAGQLSAPVLLDAIAPTSALPQSVTSLTATLDGTTTSLASVRVLGLAEQPNVVSITPDPAFMVAGSTQTFTVALDIPAPPGGATIDVSVSPQSAGAVPAAVLAPMDAMSATFDYVDGSTALSGVVTATRGASSASAAFNIVGAIGSLVINEVDYDQIGADTAEFVEILNGSALPVDLANLALVLVNGSPAVNAEYKRIPLAPAGVLAAGQYLVVGSTSVSALPPALKIDFALASNNVENGSPDALGILDLTTNTLVDALSYEGSVLGASVMGAGTLDFVEGVVLDPSIADSNTIPGSLCRSPNGVDTNQANADWIFCNTPTPGGVNTP